MESIDIIKVLNDKGKVVAIKTDTVYGLVCNAFDKLAVQNIYKIKNRETKKPLSIFVRDISQVDKYAETKNLTEYSKNLMEKYWPGKLTIVFKKKGNKLDHLLSGFNSIAIRIPNDDTLLDILNKIDFPLAQTSCNISGEKEFTSAKEIELAFSDRIDLIVDGGILSDNKPSTIISVEHNEPIVLRSGDIKI